MDVIILAGGLGTRLNKIFTDIPKPMVPINGKPFIEYTLNQLNAMNFKHVVFAVGYKHKIIREYFSGKYKNITIDYSISEFPLGTGGALKEASHQVNGQDILALNGDSYNDIDFNHMIDYHLQKKSEFTIAVKYMKDTSRYGIVKTQNEIVEKFEEKKSGNEGLINRGIYIISKGILLNCSKEKFSFEEEILEKYSKQILTYNSNEFFIDIGIPEDYYKAQMEEVFNKYE